MLCLHRILALLLWYFLLLHRRALTDEDAQWGPTPSIEKSPQKKSSNSWWKFSLPFSIPFYGSSERKDEDPVFKTTVKDLTERNGLFLDNSGSGDRSIPEGSHPPTTLAQELLTSVTEIQTESLPQRTSDWTHRSTVQNNNDALVSSTSSFITNTVFASSPTSSDTPKQNATHTHLPWGTTEEAQTTMDVTTKNLSTEQSVFAVNGHFSETSSPTMPSETTITTPLTWHATTPDPIEVMTTPAYKLFLGSVASFIPKDSTVSDALSSVEGSVSAVGDHLSETAFPTMPLETSITTALTWHATTPDPIEVMTTPANKLFLGSVASFIPKDSTVSDVLSSVDTTISETKTTQSQTELIISKTSIGYHEEHPERTSAVVWIDPTQDLESIAITTQTHGATFPMTQELPRTASKEEEEGASPSASSLADESTSSTKQLTASLPRSTGNPLETPSTLLYTEEWMSASAKTDFTLLPDCNKEFSGICNSSSTGNISASLDMKPTQNTSAINQSNNPLLMPAPPMLVPLYTDWNSALAAWGLAWEAHVYGTGCVFALLTLASALNLLCLPLRCPSGCGYFTLVSLFLLAAGCIRSFSLLYDAYGYQDRISSTEASLMLYEAPFPCLTAAFGLVFLLLSMRSRMQLSYSAFQRPCFLACLVVLHFAAAFGPATLLNFYQQKPHLCLFLSLISRGAFVALATFLSAAYFVFYIYVRADSKHIYHLNNTSPTPAERYNRCPFADSREWNRAAVIVCLSALFSLACAGLQLYAMLNAMGVAGGKEVFHPWPWWAFQFSCRVCELGVCLTIAFVVAQPIYCSDQLPGAGSCWTELLASKSPILPGSYQWTLTQHEKLAIVDTVGLTETESLPLYTLMDERLGSSLNCLDLLYHSNRALAYRDLEMSMNLRSSEKPEDAGGRELSGGSSFTSDSTTDLRPPSPINLRRSIDEALFSEALFPMSLFSPARPFRCSDVSVNNHWTLPSKDPPSADPGLYRTSSCLEMASQPQGDAPSKCSSSCSSSPERWRGSSSSCSLYRASFEGSSLVLCPSPGRHRQLLLQKEGANLLTSSDPQRQYQTLGSASQESLNPSTAADQSVQEEFISVCRQIDASSICSETIDL
uniref:Proline rich transmembrane protein 4b n=1 Tax=Oryzias sinensis TaxID=183150 RepID=A0A8C8E0R5_9TELE